MRTLFGLLILLLATLPAAAQQTSIGTPSFQTNAQGEVRLVAANTAVGSGDTVKLGLSFTMKPGWHVYWRSPGAAGFPASLDWKGSDNLAAAAIAWPAPKRFTDSGLETYGYDTQLVLPLTVKLDHAGQALHAALAVDYLICAEVCVPKQVSLALDLPAGVALPGHDFQTIARFESQVPGDGVRDGLKLVAATATADNGLSVVVDGNPPLRHPDLIVERADQLQFAAPKVSVSADGLHAVLETHPVAGSGTDADKAKPVAGSVLVVTLLDGDRRMETRATAAAPSVVDDPHGLLVMLGIALLGGLILNLMPCVLPVLGIKLLSVVGAAGVERRRVRGTFLAIAAGVLVSFAALAGGVLAVKAAGGAVGWGLQFQQPGFLTAMGMVMVIFGANLVGLFEIPLPAWAGEHGAKGGAFASGVFSTLLATPCSAPFVGTAVGFALGRGPGEILAIFLALGVGMALPYLVVAAFPRAVAWLPRPGKWMVWLRRILGFALFGTAFWLLSVLSAESGAAMASSVGIAMFMVIEGLIITRRFSPLRRVGLIAIPSLAAVIAATLIPPQPFVGVSTLAQYWQPFDPASISSDVGGGKVVFVDVTARWCLTCQVNEAAVMTQDAVADKLAAPGTVAMRADWTRPDPSIASYLAGFGRYGIPFNVVYGPAAPQGIALPELLTPDVVLSALSKAAGRG